MDVAYVLDLGVERRNVPIDSVEPGHSGSSRAWEQLAEAGFRVEVDGARKVREHGVEAALIDLTVARELLQRYTTDVEAERSAAAEERVAEERELLLRWLDEH